MRILLVPSGYMPSPGGVALNTHELAKHLMDLGHEVIILTSNWRQWHLRFSEKIDNLQVYRLPFYVYRGKPMSLIAFLVCFPVAMLGTYLLVRRIKPDIINVHFVGTNALYVNVVQSITKTPLIVTFHGNEVITVSDPISLGYTSTEVHWMRRITSMLCKRADYILGVSQYLIREVKKSESNISTKTYSILLASSFATEFPSSSKSPINRPYILAVGRFSKEKGMDLLVEAFQDVVSVKPEACLVIVGDGPDRESIESSIATKGLDNNVILTGMLPKTAIYPYYDNCLCLIVPSRSEGLPTVILEAFSFGKPVIGTKVGGIPEAITDGITGLLVEPDNKVQMANAIIGLLEDTKLRQELGNNARNFVQKIGGWNEVAQQYIDVYEQAIRRHLNLP